jgi:glycerophosphoryl diester phosphodiesterase
MLTLGVDNIITDRPDLALEIINSKKVGDTALIILEKIFAS